MALGKKMRTGFSKYVIGASLLLSAVSAYSMPSTIMAYAIMEWGFTYAAAQALAFVVTMVASAVVSKAFFSPAEYGMSGASPNPGNRAQVPPATDNKLPVVYGSAYLGGIITDLSITDDNQDLYYVIALCEVTGNGADTITFGNVYWGGKRCVFNGTNAYKVDALVDESTNTTDTSIAGKMEIYLYRNGSGAAVNSGLSAIQVMSASNLTYKWDSTKLMTNCAFAIVKITYSSDAGLTGMQQTKFQVTNSRTAPGDCFYDYMTDSVYGAALTADAIDQNSLNALNVYSAQSMNYTTYEGVTAALTRFKFDGVIDTGRSIMDNLQDMASCCDCLLRYNEITGKWGVIVQQPSYTVVMDLNDSNMVSALQVTPLDIAASYNVIECKFPDNSNQDAFNSATFDLAQIDPALLYPNEPVNKQSVALPLVNNNVRAQYLANRMLKASREDLQLMVNINFSGIQLEAGDVVTVTNANYGWVAKLFRILKVTEDFASDGAVTAKLQLAEFNPSVYSDVNVTQFTPAPNTGIPNPLVFGSIPAPIVSNLQPTIANPTFSVQVTAAQSGVIQYAEIWYSAYSNPSSSQRIFAGTTSVRANGSPYTPGALMDTVALPNIPTGDWYFFTRMANSLGTSGFSPASSVLRWRPSTFQYTSRYLVVAYADSITGTGFSSSPIGKQYYGLLNSDVSNFVSTPASYQWFFADPSFGTSVKLLYSNRTGRKFSFATGFATYAAGSGRYVPSQTAIYDQSVWSALQDGTNYIDLDARTGQLIQTGTTSTGSGEIAVINNSDGKVVASLAQLLDFGHGVQTFTGSAANLTIDIYGRVLGFVAPDDFYYTMYNATATAGQTVFTPTARQADYIVGMDLVFRNGALLDTTDYTENSTTVTLGTGAASGDKICIISMRAISSGNAYVDTNMNVSSVASAVVTYDAANLPWQTVYAGDKHTFANTGTPTQYTVQSVNAATRQITYTTTVSGVSAGANIYVYRSAGLSYRPFSRQTATFSGTSTYTPTTWAFDSGYEKLYLNGASVNDQDYDLVSGALTNFSSPASGLMTMIQFTDSNTTTPIGNQTSQAAGTVPFQSTYYFNLNQDAFELYYNGALQVVGVDYTTGAGSYTLASAPDSSIGILQQTTYQRTDAA